MPSILFIRLLTPAERLSDGFRLHCQWLLIDDDGRRQQGWADYEDLQALASGQGGAEEGAGAPALAEAAAVVALAPNDQVLCLQCEVPGRRAGQLKQALPFVVEEFLAADIEDMHIAPGPVRSGAPVRCSLVAKTILEDWLACLASAGLAPQHLVAESELLPSAADRASILFDGAAALIRCGGQAANVERANLGLALSALNVAAVRCINGALTEAERRLFNGDVEEAEALAEAATENGAEQSVIGYLAERWTLREEAINLLQDAYKPAPKAVSEADGWRRAAVLAALWLLLGLLGTAAKGWWSASQADALEARSLALYRDIFPNDRSVTAQSLRRRLNARLGTPAQGADASLVNLVGHLAAALKPSMTVASINYNRSRGEFNVDLLLQNYEDVETLREALAAKAETQITSAEQVERGVRARFRMRGV